MLRALLWDVDGTLAESERDGHRVAFNAAFASLGLDWQWSEAHYGALLRVTGRRERLLADMQRRADAPTLADEREALARELHRRKNEHYAALVRDGAVSLREGVRELVEQAAAAGLEQAIVTTTSRSNVQALLARHFGLQHSRRFFSTWVCGEDVAAKKPHPEVYQRALTALALGALDCLAIEDSPSGVAAARAADVPVLVTRSAYFADDTVEAAVAIGPGLHERRGWSPALADEVGAPGGLIRLDDLRRWHARMEHASHVG